MDSSMALGAVEAPDSSAFDNTTPVEAFLRAAVPAAPKTEVDSALAVAKRHWIESVADIRLLVREGELQGLGLADAIQQWIVSECTKVFLADKNFSLGPQYREIELIYETLGDTAGVFYFLGTRGGIQPYANPAETGMVLIQASTLMADSHNCTAFIGRDLVRCVTRPLENSWVQMDLGKYVLKPSAYCMRHYSSWDTEALRNWELQASMDSFSWEPISRHQNDGALSEKGAWAHWPLSSADGKFYRFFRVFQTGLNSNRHHYLAISGLELYGTLRQPLADADPDKPYEFVHQSDFDTNGVFYFIGTRGGTERFVNPGDLGAVKVTSSSLALNVDSVNLAVGRDVVRCVTLAKKDQWFAFELLDYELCPTAYTIRHYNSYDTEALRKWRLEASHDGRDWTVIMNHDGDTALEGKGGTHTWKIPHQYQHFSHFRIYQFGLNSNNHWYLACAGTEFYGQLRRKPRASSDLQGPANSVMAAESRVFRYVSDFDDNGIVYWISTRGMTAPWTNPHAANLIRVTSSSIMADSVPLTAVVGRDSVRCVTKPQKASWIAVDLMTAFVRPTHYSLRHYSTWDTEALRNWRFEGSNDGYNWVTIRQHVKDEGLLRKGSTSTWEVRCTEFYSRFRIFQFDVNSNNHWYLACSGFELYGDLKGESFEPSGGPAAAAALSSMDAAAAAAVAGGGGAARANAQLHKRLPALQVPALLENRPRFQYTRDGDTNGVLYYLGTHGRQDAWANPAELRYVHVSSSDTMNDSAPISAVVGRDVVRCVTKPQSHAWISVRFLYHFVQPTHYTLTHYASWDTEALRNWNLEGSNDGGETWETLSQHKNDQALSGRGSMHTWPVKTTKYFSIFRILQTGPNSNSHLYVACSGFEVYGKVLVDHPDLQWSPSPMYRSEHLEVDPSGAVVVNKGSVDSWQTVKTAQPLGANQRFEILVTRSPKTTNSWMFMLGVAPAAFETQGNRQWLGAQNSWAFIAGTGGKCFGVARNSAYGEPWGRMGDLVGCEINHAQKSIEFFVDSRPQGVAFNTLELPVGEAYGAVSLTAEGAQLRLVQRLDRELSSSEEAALSGAAAVGSRALSSSSSIPPAAVLGSAAAAAGGDASLMAEWDPVLKSDSVLVNEERGALAINQGVHGDSWQIALSKAVFAGPDVQSFEIEIVENPETSNTWRMILGLVPQHFDVKSSAWLGSQGSWGYILGTGGKCHKEGKSLSYGESYKVGDRVRVIMNFSAGTISFALNGVSQGVAFSNLRGGVRAAVSFTAPHASVRLILS